MIDATLRALTMALAMGWEILWPLILGFTLSGVVQAAVSKQQMSQLLPDDRPRSIATALALGAASSSCSYAARRACALDLSQGRAFGMRGRHHRKGGARKLMPAPRLWAIKGRLKSPMARTTAMVNSSALCGSANRS